MLRLPKSVRPKYRALLQVSKAPPSRCRLAQKQSQSFVPVPRSKSLFSSTSSPISSLRYAKRIPRPDSFKNREAFFLRFFQKGSFFDDRAEKTPACRIVRGVIQKERRTISLKRGGIL